MINTVLIKFSLSLFSLQKIHEILVEVSAEIDKINSDVIKFYTCLIQSNLIEMIKLLSLIHFDFAKRMQFSCLTEKENGRIVRAKCRKVFMPIRRDDLNLQAKPPTSCIRRSTH